ncbi:MAG: exodeoxyribonuclease V subunit gamma [Myxococcota bacterium]
MLRLVYANRTEALVDGFVDAIADRRSPLEPLRIVVPSSHMQRYLTLGVAEREGVFANARFARLESLARVALGAPPLNRSAWTMAALGVLLDDAALEGAVFEPLRRYLGAAHQDGRGAAQLATRLGVLFESYALARPEMVEHWLRGAPHPSDGLSSDAPWQRALFEATVERTRRLPLGSALLKEQHRLGDGPPIYVFGLSYIARTYVAFLDALAQRRDVHVFTLNPCREFWEDVVSARDVRAAQQTFDFAEGADAPTADPPILALWGKPGREHTRDLNERAEAGFEGRFVDPLEERPSVLARLQQDVLDRRVRPQQLSADGSLVARACPNLRREIETVATSIWRFVAASPKLRFNEIAVMVPRERRADYLPALQSVFAEAQNLPHHVVDLPLLQDSPVASGALELLALAETSLRRPDLLRVLTHPAVRGPRSAAWPEIIDELGIFHGLDAEAHEGTYIEGDRLNWDQGVRRLALGLFMDDVAVSDGPVELDSERYFPAQVHRDDEAAQLAALVRSLCEDVRYARTTHLSLDEWSRFFGALFSAYLSADDANAEQALRRCLGAAAAIGHAAEDAKLAERVSYRCAAELLRGGLERLGGNRGEYLADGVVVSALAPMRAIPFRHVFILGLGEGDFPTPERHDPLDLRRLQRMPGDVRPAERDHYVFLEALLSARESVQLSWVARDALTGDSIPGAAVLEQLCTIVERDYLAPGQSLRELVRVRRHEDVDGQTPLRDALREAEAATHQLTIETADLTPPGLTWREDEGTFELSLASLRAFLEAPAQGWARAVLGLYDAREDAAAKADEPLAPEPLDRAMLLREAFEEALRQRQSPQVAYGRLVERLKAAGRWPLGLLAERAGRADMAVFESWARVYRAALSHGAGPTRVTFGDVAGRGPVERRAAIELQVGGRTVRLSGQTELLAEGGASSLVLVPRSAPPGAAAIRERLRYALRGYIDALALAASDGDAKSHRALVLYGGEGGQEASTRFGRLERAEARQILTDLSGELLSGPHAYRLPAAAVFRLARRWEGRSAESLRQALELETRAPLGPLRADELPLPEAQEALGYAERRFGPFLRATGFAS